VIIKWRKEISSRDFGDSLFGPAAVLPNAAVEWIPFVILAHRMILNWQLTLRKSDDSAPSGEQGQMISLATPLLRHNGLPLLGSQPGPRYEYGYRGKKVRLQEKLDVFFLKLVRKYGENLSCTSYGEHEIKMMLLTDNLVPRSCRVRVWQCGTAPNDFVRLGNEEEASGAPPP